MGWAKFDDRWATHPKLLAAGLEAAGLDAKAICYTAGIESDGFVADYVLPILTPGHRNPGQIAARLVDVGRWTRDDERKGYWIHDYLDYNQSRQEAEAKRSAERERRASGRKAQGRDPQGRLTSAPAWNGRGADVTSRTGERGENVARSPNHDPPLVRAPVPTRPDLKEPPTPAERGFVSDEKPTNPRALGTNPRALGTNPRGPKPPDPLEAQAAAQRAIHERHADPCADCGGGGWREQAGGAVRCEVCNPAAVVAS